MKKHSAREAHTYRAARRNAARKNKLIWRALPRRMIKHSQWVIVPVAEATL